MKTRFAVFAVILVVAVVLAVLLARKMASPSVTEAEGAQPDTGGARVPVLVELFTSEGCSSCPPADALLTRLDQSQTVPGVEVIALSEHVDYWNRLGWADPFSSAEFSRRQNDYASVFGSDEIYTPQMVVDGRVQFVGSNASRAHDAISNAARAPKADIAISLAKTSGDSSGEVALEIRVASLPSVSAGERADVLLAITESGLRSSVARGENAGRKLTHTAVVRKLAVLDAVDPSHGLFNSKATARMEKGWDRSNLKAVVFVQERATRRVLGAAAVSLAARE